MNTNFHQAIAALASRQQGNVTRLQLLNLGLGREAINYRVRTGSLFRQHRGIYSVGRPAITPREKAAAAVLACGPTAALSHGSAMANWGFWKRWDRPFEVTVSSDRRPTGIRVHHSSTLHRRDLRTHYGIRTTSAARTLHDIAPGLSDRQLARAVNDALLSNLLGRSHLDEFVARLPGSPLAAFVDTLAGLTRSQLEDDFLSFCQRYDLPRPQTNVIVAGYEVDAYFPKQRLIVELDSWRFHSSRTAFETDRNRDADHLSDGIPTVRITHERITDAPGDEAARLARILAR